MGSQIKIGLGVIGVLLFLFLAIVYSRFTSHQPVLQIPSEASAPVPTPDRQPQLKHPTIVKQNNFSELPQEAFNPPTEPRPLAVPSFGPAPPLGVDPGFGLDSRLDPSIGPSISPSPAGSIPHGLLTPAEFEARQTRQWPVPAPSESRLR